MTATVGEAGVAVELAPDDVGDVSALPNLLDQIEETVGSVTAQGAYDGDPVYDEVLQRHPAARDHPASIDNHLEGGRHATAR